MATALNASLRPSTDGPRGGLVGCVLNSSTERRDGASQDSAHSCSSRSLLECRRHSWAAPQRFRTSGSTRATMITLASDGEKSIWSRRRPAGFSRNETAPPRALQGAAQAALAALESSPQHHVSIVLEGGVKPRRQSTGRHWAAAASPPAPPPPALQQAARLPRHPAAADEAPATALAPAPCASSHDDGNGAHAAAQHGRTQPPRQATAAHAQRQQPGSAPAPVGTSHALQAACLASVSSSAAAATCHSSQPQLLPTQQQQRSWAAAPGLDHATAANGRHGAALAAGSWSRGGSSSSSNTNSSSSSATSPHGPRPRLLRLGGVASGGGLATMWSCPPWASLTAAVPGPAAHHYHHQHQGGPLATHAAAGGAGCASSQPAAAAAAARQGEGPTTPMARAAQLPAAAAAVTSAAAHQQGWRSEPPRPGGLTAAAAQKKQEQERQLAQPERKGHDDDEGQNQKEAKAPPLPLLENPIRYAKLLFAGAMSAVVSRTFVAPLERVKMDLLLKNGTGDAFTTAAQVWRTEGVRGFFKGNALNVLRTAPFKAVNFFSFDMYHAALMALRGQDGNTERFMAGACAGVTATLVCFPLDVVRTRLMAAGGPRYGRGPFTTLAGILRHEGAGALYTGCLPAVVGMAPAGAVFYGVYDLLKHRHLEAAAAASAADGTVAAGAGAAAKAGSSAGAVDAGKQQHHATAPGVTVDPLHTLLYGAMAGAASELIVYPLEVIRRKMQLQTMALASLRHQHGAAGSMGHGAATAAGAAAAAAAGRLAAAASQHHHQQQLGAAAMAMALGAAGSTSLPPALARIAAAMAAIVKADGPRGFYSGLLPNMLQVLPSAALSYYTYDTLKTMLTAR